MTPMPRARTQLPMTAVIPFAESMVMTRLETSKAAILMKGIASSLVTRTPLMTVYGTSYVRSTSSMRSLALGTRAILIPASCRRERSFTRTEKSGIVQHRVVDAHHECRAAELLEVAEDLADGIHAVTVLRDILVFARAFLLHDRRVPASARGVNGRAEIPAGARGLPIHSRSRARLHG